MIPELKAQASSDRPQIDFNLKDGMLRIVGRSLPEDAYSFYKPFIEWLNDYITEPPQMTVLTIDLEYFNTASAKQIYKIISLVNDVTRKASAKVKWHYDKGDRDMLASGQRFSKMCSLEFEFIENNS